MKCIQIVAANESDFIKAANSINLSVIKLPKIRKEGFVFYRVVAPYSQQDIFYLGVVYWKFVEV
ncbi:MAG TPA: hypothetical protein VIJ75_16035 [Hanamia sp.]